MYLEVLVLSVHLAKTRAVHIEVAQSLDTESFPAAVTRFIAGHGYPNTIISDNGKNFFGAVNELKAFIDAWGKAKIESDFARKKIVCKFNLELHILVESGETQSCKKVMVATLDNRSLTGEVLSNIMSLVEQTLNARLLTAESDNPEDFTALKPNLILLGSKNASGQFMPSSENYHEKNSFKSFK